MEFWNYYTSEIYTLLDRNTNTSDLADTYTSDLAETKNRTESKTRKRNDLAKKNQ